MSVKFPILQCFKFTATLDIPPHIVANKHWCLIRVWVAFLSVFQQTELGCRNTVPQWLSVLLPETFIMRLLWLSSGTCLPTGTCQN